MFHFAKQKLSLFQHFLINLDDWVVRQHLRRTEQRLRNKPCPSLTTSQQSARQQNLDNLREYWQAGRFPRNHLNAKHRIPVFIDEQGTHCAVGYLVAQSGYIDAAQMIANQANTAYLPEMDFPVLKTWIAQSGLTPQELTTIQPTYCPSER